MKIKKENINEHIKKADLLICSSGFEDRSVSLPLALQKNTINNAIIFHIDENYTKAIDNYNKIKDSLDFLLKIEFPKNNSLETFDIIYYTISSFFQDNQGIKKIDIVVDVTTFTREVLLILLKVLSFERFIDKSNIRLIYTPAESYPCEWLTKGVREIRSIFGYSGMISPSKKLLLIVLNGFETERTEEVIKSFEANKILLGKPSKVESINDELNEISNQKFELVKTKYHSSSIEEFEFSCLDIEKTISELERLIAIYDEDFNIIISPLNNKISTLACAFVAIKNENIQICYASANQYNIHSYSKESNYFLEFKLNDFIAHN